MEDVSENHACAIQGGPEISALLNSAMPAAAIMVSARTALVFASLGGMEGIALWKGALVVVLVTVNAEWPMMATGSVNASMDGMVRIVPR